MDASTKKTFLGIVIVVVAYFVTRIDCAPTRRGFIRVGLGILSMKCDKDGMFTVKEEGIPMCKCRDGYFLETRNKHDPDGTSRCAKCADCSNSRYRPVEVQKCGSYSDTVCCEHSNHTAEMTEHGYFDCVVEPEQPEPEVTTHHHLPGKSDPRHQNCDTGYYFRVSSEIGTVTGAGASGECVACTVCAELKNTPYEKRSCSNTSNAVCCPTTHSTVVETESGFECSPTSSGEPGNAETDIDTKLNPTTLSPPTNLTRLQHCDEDDMQAVTRNGRMSCVCNDGTNALWKDDGGYTCETTSYGGDVEPKDKEKMPRLVVMCIVIVAMALLTYPLCRLQSRGVLLGRFFSNIRQVNKHKKKERALEAERAMLSPVNVQAVNATAV